LTDVFLNITIKNKAWKEKPVYDGSAQRFDGMAENVGQIYKSGTPLEL